MLIDAIKEARMTARGAKDTPTADLLGVLIGDCTKLDKEPTDEAVVAIVKKFIDNCNLVLGDTITVNKVVVQNSASQKQKDAAAAEIAVLSVYLPSQLTEAEIRIEIGFAKDFGATNVGGIMKHFKENVGVSRYDGALVSKLAKESV